MKPDTATFLSHLRPFVVPLSRTPCYVPYSECVATDHVATCECQDEFHGNGSVACIPDGFDEEENGKSYRMFDDAYVEFENATEKCRSLVCNGNLHVCL